MTRRSRSNLDPIGRVQRDLRQLQKEADSPGTKAITTFEGWRLIGAAGQPAFQNSWVNYGGTDDPAAFWKDSVGIVWLRGRVKLGTVNTAIFTLPQFYRPGGTPRFIVNASGAFGIVKIFTNGEVWLAIGTNNNVDLDPICFRAEL